MFGKIRVQAPGLPRNGGAGPTLARKNMTWWNGLGLLGSMAVMAPAGLAIAVCLSAAGFWRLALHWCRLFAGGMALVVVSKVAFIGWGIGLPSIGFAGFSGHAMRAGAVLPVAAFLVLRDRTAATRQAGLMAGVLLAMLVAMARVAEHAHSASEALTGCALGLAVAGSFIVAVQAARQFVLNRALLAFMACALLFTPQVKPVPTEAWLTRLALHLSGHKLPYQRLARNVASQQNLLPPGLAGGRAPPLTGGIGR